MPNQPHHIQAAPPQPPPLYYLDNFQQALDWLQQRYADLLEEKLLENTLLHGVLTVYSDAIGVKVRSVGMLPSVSAVRASMDAFLAGF